MSYLEACIAIFTWMSPLEMSVGQATPGLAAPAVASPRPKLAPDRGDGREPRFRRGPAAHSVDGAHAGSTRYFFLGDVTFFERLSIQQLSQTHRSRGGENVTVMLYRLGLSARSNTCTSDSALTLESLRA